MDAAKSESSSRSSENKKRSGRRRIAVALALGALGSAILVAVSISRYPGSNMSLPTADIAVVLGARSSGERPLPVFQARIDYAIQLYRDGKVQRLLFTGGPNAPDTVAQAEIAKRYAMERGVPESAILTEAISLRTLENFREAGKLLPDPQSRILVVSDPLHLKRAMLMARDMNWRAEPAPVPQTLVRSRWNRTKFLVRETAAYIYYWLFRR